MRNAALVALLAALAPAQEDVAEIVHHVRSGLKVRLPDGWDRDTTKENDAVLLYAVLDLAPSKYVRFTVRIGPVGTHDPEKWIASQKQQLEPVFQETTQAFIADPTFKVAGREAASYLVDGTRVTQGGTEYGFRVRAAALVHGEFLFKFTETSFNAAHAGRDADLRAMWDAVELGTPDRYADATGTIEPPAGMEPVEARDPEANWRMTLPPGWQVTFAPEAAKGGTRLRAERVNADGIPIADLRVIRLISTNARTFTVQAPSDVLQRNQGFLDPIYGDDAAKTLRADINARYQLAGLDKSSEFTYEAIPFAEREKTDKAQELRDRGDTSVVVPEYLPVFVRGRVALHSPNVYIAFVHFRARTVAADEKLIAEFRGLMDAFALISKERMPPPLSVGRKRLKNTRDDPKNAEDRPGTRTYTEKQQKTHTLGIEFVVPAGWVRVPEAEGGSRTLVLAAQDGENNWILLEMFHANFLRISEAKKVPRTKREYFHEWVTNWQSKARKAKVPRRPQSVRIGRWKGKGYREMRGEVEGFEGTFTAGLDDASNWRTIIKIETRGGGREVFADGLETFGKGLKIEPE